MAEYFSRHGGFAGDVGSRLLSPCSEFTKDGSSCQLTGDVQTSLSRATLLGALFVLFPNLRRIRRVFDLPAWLAQGSVWIKTSGRGLSHSGFCCTGDPGPSARRLAIG